MGDPVSLVVNPILNNIIDTAATLAKEEVALVRNVKEDVKKLSSILTSIQATLNDAEERQLEDEQIRDWLGKLKDVAYDADDVLQIFATNTVLCKRERFQTPFNARKISYRSDAAHDIKMILKRLDEIAKEKENFNLKVNVSTGRPLNLKQTTPTVNATYVFGREDDKEKLMHLLLPRDFTEEDDSSEEDDSTEEDDFSVIPIIGMGGLGKTTLAQLLFNDERVKKHFKSLMWVCVTADFDLRRILKEMIEYHSKMKYSSDLSESLLESRLLEFLVKKRFLLVLDDVWIEEYLQWEQLLKILQQGKKGSKVLVTSQSSKVANITGTQSPYCLSGLPEGDCRSLFKKIAFDYRNLPTETLKKLEPIGWEIVAKCSGLPLAVKAMAGVLRQYDDLQKWQRIASSNIWELEKESSNTNRPNILPALSLSYYYLPPKLKQCFAFCSIFPKAYAFDKRELVKHWIAQSFLQPEGQETEEEVGLQYFDALLLRSFFQLLNVDNRVKYQMHGLIQDLAQSVSSPYCSQVKDSKSCSTSRESRHVSILCTDLEKPIMSITQNSKKLRTLLLPGGSLRNFGHALNTIFHNLTYLRELDLSSSTLMKLPEAVEELKLLRYLDLSQTEIRALPNSICNLYNLKTLKLLHCRWLFSLPKNLGNLDNLRDLELDDMFWFKSSTMPPRIQNLTSLHDLHSFSVGCKSGYGIEELKKMENLTGTIRISKLENAVNGKEACMKQKKNLCKVVYEWSKRVNNPQEISDDEKVLEDLKPHSNVKELQIINYLGINLPQWIREGQLQNLVTVSLSGCTRCKILSLGQLPQLGELYIKGMLELETWPDGLYQSLNRLKISNCPKLNQLPDIFPNLGVMKIKNCCSLQALPVTPSLQFSTLIDNLVLQNWHEAMVRFISLDEQGQTVTRVQPSFFNLLEMKVINCPKLQDLPQAFAPQKLEISGCGLISTLPIPRYSKRLQHLSLDACPDGSLVEAIPDTPSMYSLVISNITNLSSFPKWPNLPGLTSLYISNCKDLVSLSESGSLRSFTSLKLLSVRGCEKLESLPDEGLPIGLEFLTVGSCSSMVSLGTKATLKSLTSLKDLCIEDCPKIKSFPEDGLPTSLQHLVIKNCDSLTGQCRKEDPEGPEWQKIKDIPDLEIAFAKVPNLKNKKKASSTAWRFSFGRSKGSKQKRKGEPGESSSSAGSS